MRAPWESCRSRVLWSVVALAILGLWEYGILAASTVPFAKVCKPAEVFQHVIDGGMDGVWPGEYGRDWNPLSWTVQFAPLIGAAFWMLCLVPWRARTRRIGVLVTALLLPAWSVVFVQPFGLVLWPVMLSRSLFLPMDGEDLQENGIWISAAAMWWWFMVLLIVVAVFRRVPKTGECPSCGYSTVGLPGAVCPECGGRIAVAGREASGGGQG